MNNNDRIGAAKKALLPALIAVIVLLGLIVGATWAFFTAKVTNSSTPTTASAKAPKIPLVTLQPGVTSLSMDLSVADMKGSSDGTTKTYYASETGRVDSQSTSPTIATLSLSNDEKNTYTCDYTITAKATVASDKKSLIAAYSDHTTNTNELMLKLNNQPYDLATSTHNTAILRDGIVYNGSIDVNSSEQANLTAQFSFTSNSEDQTFINNTEAIINITVALTGCNLKTTS